MRPPPPLLSPRSSQFPVPFLPPFCAPILVHLTATNVCILLPTIAPGSQVSCVLPHLIVEHICRVLVNNTGPQTMKRKPANDKTAAGLRASRKARHQMSIWEARCPIGQRVVLLRRCRRE
jgi:hypothetical protein